MLARTHVLFGLSCWAAYSHLQHIPFQPVSYLMVGFASLLPDIDHPKSTFGRCVPFISYPISMILGHRGITHSLFAVFGCLYVITEYGLQHYGEWILPLTIGYLSHLIGDGITCRGIPIFWPYTRRFGISMFTTGGFIEYLVMLGLASFLGWYMWESIFATIRLRV